MGRIRKGQKCNVKGCEKPAYKSISLTRFKSSGLDWELTNIRGSSVYLCREHYKEFKKKVKKTSKFEKWQRFSPW